MKLRELLDGLEYQCPSGLETEIRDIVYDSRKAGPGDLFVCLKGAASDGHKYARQAVENGAAAVVAEHEVDAGGCPVVIVENTRRALAYLSAAYFHHPADRIRVIGVTGTKGKTTTAHMIRAILERAGIRTGLIGTIGVAIGDRIIPTENTTPESYEVQKFLNDMIEDGCQCCVMEASSIGLRDFRLAGFTFEIGVFTNFSEDHIGGTEHQSMEEYMECKSMLFRQCRTGIVNIDDPSWQGIVRNHTCTLETYGFSPQAELRAEQENLIAEPGYVGVHFELRGRREMPVDVDIPGHFSVYNALAAIAVCLHFDVPDEAIRDGLNTVKVKGRVEPLSVPGNYTLLIDYAHNAVSMENILTTLRAYRPNRLICLFGAGGNRSRTRRYEMGEVCGKLADLSVITADNSRFEDVNDIIADILIGTKKTDGKYIVIPDRREAMRWCIENAQDGDIIVFAGKGHEDYQEIRGKKYPFDERVVTAEILKELGQTV